MNAIQRLCGRAILLHNGQLAVSGETSEVIAEYLKATDQLLQRSNLVDLPANLRRGNGLARFTSIELLDVDGRFVHELQMGEPVIIRMTIVAKERIPNTIFGFSFITSDGVEIGGSVGHDGGLSGDLEAGSQTFCCVADPMVLTPGRYYLRAAIFRLGESFDHIDEALAFDVIPASTNLAAAPHGHYVGHIYIPWKWSQLDSSEALDVVHTLEPSRN